jgi:phosphate transport system permease protein
MSDNSIKDRSWRQRRRNLIDQFAARTIGMGGISVIFAIVLIFFYLLWVVAPIFQSAEVLPLNQFSIADPANADYGKSPTKYIAVEESGHLGMRIDSAGRILFFDLTDGKLVHEEQLELAEYSKVIHVTELDSEGMKLAVALNNNRLIFIGISYRVNFIGEQRMLEPGISYLFGEEALELNYINNISLIDAALDESVLTLSVLDTSGQILLQKYEVEEGDELAEPESETVIEVTDEQKFLQLDPLGEWLYLASHDGQLTYFNISDIEDVEQIEHLALVKPERTITQFEMLLGGVSIIVGDDQGSVQQWSLQRDEKNQYKLVEVRGFKSASAVTFMAMEKRRKGLLVLDRNKDIVVYHTTAEKVLFQEKLEGFESEALFVSMSSRADRLMIETTDHQYFIYKINNHHPELSWNALWNEVTYESYTKPEYIWQSSSADNDFEPKFSLSPLVFGTLKAAFYAMLIAMPLAIMGAIYTAYFMAPKMRSWVKPSIEIMEALPTVILGFLAGLWLAPIVEDNLLAILSLSFVLPAGLLLFSWVWVKFPKAVRYLVPSGWQAALLVPVVISLTWLSFELAPLFEAVFFNGDLPGWMLHEFGIGYDQRNSLVVGIAMGLAVIPTIFSITEDAIFSVPRQLTTGSLALGATPWQTLMRVVLLTASPGIFSAVMIGLGRAVGETMIVLMATGNTPIMDMSIFQGMRTLSANIAVELPESEVDSTHYRILFLAAFVLFVVTFVFNTMAELVRQNLRKRYGSL